MNLARVLLAGATAAPESIALHDGDDSYSYRELERRGQACAAGLLGRGTRPGDRVAIVLGNGVEFVTTYLGALAAGAVAVPLNPESPPAELTRQLATVGPACVVGGAGLDDAVTPASLGAAGAGGVAGTLPVDRAASDDAVLLFTAGTSGSPRPARLTHGNLAANLEQLQSHPGHRVRAEDVGLCALPLFHVFGLNVALAGALAAGAAAVVVDRFEPVATAALVRSRRVTVVVGVPAMFESWLALDDDAAPAATFGAVRLAVSGAAPLRPECARRFEQRFGVVLHEGYGLTEAAPVVTTSAVEAGSRPGSIGPPLPGVEVRLVDVDGADVIAGDPGEIWVRGPNVFPGYWHDPDATARVLAGGWLRTGDVAVSDDDGFLSIVDRLKDVVIVSGFNVYPAEVEDVLRGHPDVADVAVVGVPDARSGESVAAFVVAASGAAPDPQALRAFAATHLARYKCPSTLEVVRQLPRNAAGKVVRRELDHPG